MSIAEAAPSWLIVVLLVLLTLAAAEDGWRLRISNVLVAGVALGGLAAIAFAGLGWGAWQPVALAILLLAIGTPMFGAGWLGGGDVKLLAASGLWFTFSGGWRMLVMVAVTGGALTLLILIARRLPWPDTTRDRVVVLQRRGGIPYGIAIAVGMAATVMIARAAPPAISAAPSSSLALPR